MEQNYDAMVSHFGELPLLLEMVLCFDIEDITAGDVGFIQKATWGESL